MTDIQYGRIVTEIISESRFGGKPANVKKELREDIKSNKRSLLKDIVDSLDLFKTTTTPEITITIRKDKFDDQFLLQRQWVVSKEKVQK